MPTPKQVVDAKLESMNKRKFSPTSLLLWKKIGGKASGKPLRCLFDSGGDNTMINRRALPKDAEVTTLSEVKSCQTVAGTWNANTTVKLREGILPEFDRHKKIYGLTATVFDAPDCPHDVIIGRDLLYDLGIDMSFKHLYITWMDKKVFFKPKSHWQHHTNWTMAFDAGVLDVLDEHYDDDGYDGGYYDPDDDAFIMDAKYEATSAEEVANKQEHLSVAQRKRLAEALADTKVLFDGKLGHFQNGNTLVHLDIEENAEPVHAKPYSVPQQHEPAFLKELKHLCEIGVLEEAGRTEWASPTFIIPKKDGRVRWISDLRELNKVLKRKVYPLPLIDDIVSRRKGYKYFTKLDLTMMYYSFELDEESKDRCTIITPYGKFRYRRMAMGLKPAPDIAQYHIESVLRDLKNDGVEVYIDDIGLFSDSFEDHMILIEKVVKRLQDNSFKINPLKCEWCVQETDFLGHWLTPDSVKPWKKKVEAILKMSKPQNTTQLRAFLGAVTYYRHMWPRRSHLLHPLTQLTSKPNLSEWDEKCDKAFEEMKAVMASDVMMSYPDPNVPFEIYTDASDYQMGAVIMQKGKPVAYWSRKLNAAQRNYSVMEKEMLSIVHLLKEFRSMLYGTKISIYTDHKNLTFRTLNTQRVLRWRMYMEEFGPDFHYLPGKDNVIADGFSRLPRMEKPSEGKSAKGKLIAFDKLDVKMDPQDEMFSFEADVLVPPPTEAEFNKTFRCKFSCCRDGDGDHFHGLVADDEIMEQFLNHPPLHIMHNPITMQNIQTYQTQDAALMQMAAQDPMRYPIMQIDNRNIICYRIDPVNRPNEWRIYIPPNLVQAVIVWYHVVLGHRGTTSLYVTISRRFYTPGMKRRVENLRCEVCQFNKSVNVQYRHLPERHADLVPWNSVAVDLIGLWKITVNGVELEFNALTCIDPVTNLTELVALENKMAEHVASLFEQTWLARYPKPLKCIHDQGGEFIGQKFQDKLMQWGIVDGGGTSKNPTANAICERMHLTVGNILRTRFNNNVAPNVQVANDAVREALAACNHAMRCAVSKALLNNTPGEVVFGRDMLLNIPVMVDLVRIQENRQLLINENLRRQNAKRKEFDFRVNGEVLLKVGEGRKLNPKFQGPFRITEVFTNGTVRIQLTPNVTQRVNIRRLVPFRRV